MTNPDLLADLKCLVAGLQGTLTPGEREQFDAILDRLGSEPEPLAVVEGWMTQRHLAREDTNAVCVWLFPEGQDKEKMLPVTVTVTERPNA